MTKSIEERLQVIEDREAIATLQARYVNYNDGGWRGPTHQYPKAVAGLFTEDGVWEGPTNDVRAEGAAAIEALFTQFQAIPFIVHYVMNALIEINGDQARGEWHAIVATTSPDHQSSLAFGKYVNEYRRTEDSWKYTKMSFEAAAIATFPQGWTISNSQ